jgi:hypothetical protein
VCETRLLCTSLVLARTTFGPGICGWPKLCDRRDIHKTIRTRQQHHIGPIDTRKCRVRHGGALGKQTAAADPPGTVCLFATIVGGKDVGGWRVRASLRSAILLAIHCDLCVWIALFLEQQQVVWRKQGANLWYKHLGFFQPKAACANERQQ